ncbi:MAG TPA: choline dehydrogenase [Steroidobacteraceae bacterium]|nr:choline dehydrogenase [Steroidobacteraceae bacterium]
MIRCDHAIVGAGSAGCVLANRLSADPARRVLLIEAGGGDWHPMISMPAGIARLVGMAGINWDYVTEPEPELNGRRLWWPRGRVLGGSSSINAMCYIRGQREDYDGWAADGCPGWNYDAVLPYFKRAEDQQRGADDFHGAGGPLAVSDLRYRNRLSETFLAAGRELGIPENPDFNATTQLGLGWYQVTQRAGRRSSAAAAYLAPVRRRPNLAVLTRTQATRVLLEQGRVAGVEVARGGRRERIEARSVTLAGGAINSPQLLMLSGIGPAKELEAHGIKVAQDLPGVGENLQDHLDYCTLVKSREPVSYDFNALQEVLVGLRYFLTHDGPGSSNIAEAGAFLTTPRARGGRPDVQLHFVPAQLDDHGRNRLPGHGYTFHCCVLQPKSRGRIRLASADPLAKARIFANYLSDRDDATTLIAGLKMVREIAAARAFDRYRGEELFPGAAARTDEALLAAIRAKAESIYHPCGSCRMGSDPRAVVDPNLRVRGVDGLTIVDASVMPTLVSGNTNAPTIMIAERAAERLAA